MKNKKQGSYNINSNNNFNTLSPTVKEHYLNPIEECPETEDIIKKIENLNFSSDEKSFETPYISLSKPKNIKNLQSNKSISIPNLIIDNNTIDDFHDFPFEFKSIKDSDIIEYSHNNNYNYISNILNNKDENIKEEKNNDIYELLLKEKINRICMLLQTYNINQKCYNLMNNFIPCITDINSNLYKPIDSILEVILELLFKIKGEYTIKEGLTNKLNTISLNKEDYEKKIFEIKKELIYKEKEIESLINKNNNKIKDKSEIKDYSNQNFLLEFNNTKKENQFLFEKILSYKSQIKSIYSQYKILFNKYKICLKEMNNTNKENKNIILIKEAIIHFSLNIKKSNERIITEAITSPKKLTNDLILFLFDINKMLFKYDFALVKMNKNNNIKTPLNDIRDLNPSIDINYLLNERNYKIFCKYFFCNMDIIYNKIINMSINKDKGNNKESKRVSGEKKNINGKYISLNNSKINQSINLYLPKSNAFSKNFKSYISIKKFRNKEKSKNLVRNSTSRNGFSFINFYSDADLEDNFTIKNYNNKKEKVINKTVNTVKRKKNLSNNDKI